MIPLKKTVTECKQSQMMRKKKDYHLSDSLIGRKKKTVGATASGVNKMRPWPLLFGRDEEACGLRERGRCAHVTNYLAVASG